RATNEFLFGSIKRLSSEKGRANWPLCLVFPKGRIEGVKAKRPVCPTLAPRFSLFQGLVSGELRLRPLAAGSIDTFLNEMEPAFLTTSLDSTPRNAQSMNRTSSITAPGKPATHITRGLDALRTFSIVTLRTTGLCGPSAPVS